MVWFADSQFSSVLVPQDREVLRVVRVRHLAVPVVATSAADRIPPAQHAQVSRRVQEWAERQDCRLRACRPNRPVVPVALHAAPDSVISTGLKKVR